MSKIRVAKFHTDLLHDAAIIDDVLIFHHNKPRKCSKKPWFAILDTGSDVSTIPKSVVNEIGLQQAKTQFIPAAERGLDELQPIIFYKLSFKVCGKMISTDWGMPSDDAYIKLGRDVLVGTSLKISWVDEKGGELILHTDASPLQLPKP